MLDSPREDADTGRAGALLFELPRRQLVAHQPEEVPCVLDAVDKALEAGHHVAGLLAYEAGYALDATLPDPPPLDGPLAWFGVYDAPVSIAVETALADLAAPLVEDAAWSVDVDDYRARIRTIQDWIRAGDVYQINLTAPLRFTFEGDPLALYAALRRAQPASYGAFLSLGGRSIASASPELFVRIDREGDTRKATTRPMKGTAPRGRTATEDVAQTRALQEREKDRAENLMIVDLLRNDLARVSVPGSVVVPSLFDAEHYPTVVQMTSTVRSTVRDDASLGDVLRALFPCGSVTGAPKHRAMQRIRELEPEARGVYCGAIGYAAPDGTAAFSVAIRTAVVAEGVGRYDVGSGVVWDSRADDEYAECLLKARILTDLSPSR